MLLGYGTLFQGSQLVYINLVVDVNSVVYKFSGAYKNTVVDKNSVVCKSSEKMVDGSSVLAQFSGVNCYTCVSDLAPAQKRGGKNFASSGHKPLYNISPSDKLG